MQEKIKTTRNKKIIIFLISGIIIVFIIAIAVFLLTNNNENTDENQKEKKVNVENFEVNDEILSDLKFEAVEEDKQINVTVTNVSNKDLDIKSFVVNITDKEGTIDTIELAYNDILPANNQTNLSFGYTIDDVDKMAFDVIYNSNN